MTTETPSPVEAGGQLSEKVDDALYTFLYRLMRESLERKGGVPHDITYEHELTDEAGVTTAAITVTLSRSLMSCVTEQLALPLPPFSMTEH